MALPSLFASLLRIPSCPRAQRRAPRVQSTLQARARRDGGGGGTRPRGEQRTRRAPAPAPPQNPRPPFANAAVAPFVATPPTLLIPAKKR
eukprot:2717483-Prymnesium_polylepis.2